MTATGGGATWTNALDVDGSITVLTVTAPPPPTDIAFSVSGDQLTLNWPTSHLGWIPQTQVNSFTVGFSNNRVDVVGTGSSTQAVININPADPTAFFRLRSP